MRKFLWSVLILFLLASAPARQSFSGGDPSRTTVRVGHLPNITHAQALVGQAQHLFEDSFKDTATVKWTIFNAGPSVIEALFAGSLDIAYVGPSPAINGYVKSDGQALRVIAGSASGGAALVVRQGSGITTVQDFHGKKIASPQFGNTQDVALRSWLSKNDLVLKNVGGDVQIVPLSNADQQTLFLKGEIDAAWTVEPWVSLLVKNAGGKIFLDEAELWPSGEYATTLVVVRTKFLGKHPKLVKKFLETHVAVTDWINQNPVDAKITIAEEIEKEIGRSLPVEILEAAIQRVRFTTNSLESSVKQQALAAFGAGFLKKEPDLSGLFVMAAELNQILKHDSLDGNREQR